MDLESLLVNPTEVAVVHLGTIMNEHTHADMSFNIFRVMVKFFPSSRKYRKWNASLHSLPGDNSIDIYVYEAIFKYVCCALLLCWCGGLEN